MKSTTTITRRRRGLLGALLGLLAAGALPAQAQKQYDPGASDSEIRLGMAMPFSGPASSYGIVGKVAEAYFKMLNEQQGGINGRKVTVIAYDDQYTPPKTTEVVRRLVEQDEVLAVFGNLGSASNAAITRYMNAKKVPQIFIGVGAERFNAPKTAPWTLPFMPSYDAEGRLYAQNILKTKPNAKIAVLYQNDDFGRDLLKGFKSGLGAKAGLLVAEASYEMADPTVDSQIIKLQASGADVFVNFSTARFAAQAIRKVWDIGWRPEQQYLTYVSAYVKMTLEPAGLEKSKGILAMAFFKDAVQPRWAADPATRDYLAFMKQYAPGEDVNNAAGVYGYCVAQAMAHVLRQSGAQLTREHVMKQAATLKDFKPSMLLPGLAMNTSAQDYFPFSALQLVQFNGREFEPLGQAIVVK